jgi:glycosyltransferase involved in cell wall biosynthesis
MRPSKMQLSVVIPVYNEEQTVGNIIERTKIALQQQGLD